MARKKKKEELGDVVTNILVDALGSLVDQLKSKIVKPFPFLMKKISKKLLMKYMWFLILGTSGIVILGMGIAEYITVKSAIPKEWSLILVGLIIVMIGIVQFKNKEL